MPIRYQVVELDANDKSLVLREGLTQGEARAMLARLRATFGNPTWNNANNMQVNVRYIMRKRAL